METELRYVIEKDEITNVIVVDPEEPPANLVMLTPSEVPVGAGIGWKLVDGEWVDPDLLEQE